MTRTTRCRSSSAPPASVTFQANTTALYDPTRSSATNRVATANTGNVAAAAYLGYANYEVRVAKGRYYIRQNEDTAYIQDNSASPPA